MVLYLDEFQIIFVVIAYKKSQTLGYRQYGPDGAGLPHE